MVIEHSNTMAADHAVECGGDGIVIGHLVKGPSHVDGQKALSG
jgi:hypothetical protein